MNFLVTTCYRNENKIDLMSHMLSDKKESEAIEVFSHAPFEKDEPALWSKLVDSETGDVYATWSKDLGFEIFPNGSILISLEEWSEITGTDLKLAKD